MPERVEFKREVENLYKDLAKMSSLIEKSMDDMIEVLLTQNAELARDVIERDDEIDSLELKVERDCVLLIARQQPIASDLRDVAAILKIITDLERIADHCSDICKYVINLSKEAYVKPLAHIAEMVEIVKSMVTDTINSCIKKDLQVAQDVIKRDDEVDKFFYMIIDELLELMQSNSEAIPQYKEYMFIVKYLERMGDHATNVAEWIIYCVTGLHV